MREPKPVTRYEVSEKNKKLRQILIVVLLAVAVVSITTGIMSLLNKESGWQKVEITTEARNCSQNFIFQYNFSGSGAEATALNKQLEAAYSDASVKAYQLFTPDEGFEGVNNVYYINRHPNEEIVVDPVLYDAFAKLEGTRYLYLGPVYAHYNNLIFNASDAYVQQLDPTLNGDATADILSMAHYAADEAAVRLELLGENRVKLHVSQTYLAFAKGEEIGENFLDFSYLTNAFIIDYFADTMQALGLTEGYFASVDGYTRNLDSKNTFHFNIFDRIENMVYPAATMQYRGPISMVFLKNYPTAESDAAYRISGDHFVHLLADPVDGMYKTSRNNLVGYSYDLGCADVLLKMLPQFVTDEDFTAPGDIYSIWCENATIYYNDEAIRFTDLLADGDLRYTTQLVK